MRLLCWVFFFQSYFFDVNNSNMTAPMTPNTPKIDDPIPYPYKSRNVPPRPDEIANPKLSAAA